MLHPHRLYFYNLLMLLVPETSCFALKRGLLRWCGATVGSNVRICSSARFYGTGELIFGEDVWVGGCSNISSGARVLIGTMVGIGPGVYIGTGSHEIDVVGLRSCGQGFHQGITVEDGVWIGLRATLFPGVTIGRKSVVGACALVTHNVPARTFVVGIPAKVQRTF